MRRFAAIAALVAVASAAPSVHAEPVHRVLFLFSDGRSLPANVEAERAFSDTLRALRGDRVQIDTEFFDRARFAGAAYDAALVNLFREKYSGEHTPEAIVAGGLYAVHFLLDRRDAVFARVPVVFVGLSAEEVSKLAPLPPDVIGVPVEFDYRGSIMAALKLHPNARRLVLIVGANPLDR